MTGNSVTGMPSGWAKPWQVQNTSVDTGGLETGARVGLAAGVGVGVIGGLGNASQKLMPDATSLPWAQVGRAAVAPVLLGAAGGMLVDNLKVPDTVADGVVQGALLATTIGAAGETVRAFSRGSGAGPLLDPKIWRTAGKVGVVAGSLAAEYAAAKPLMAVPDSAVQGVAQGIVIGAMTGTALQGAKWLGAGNQNAPMNALKVGALGAVYLGQVGLLKEHITRPDNAIDGFLKYGVLGVPVLGGSALATKMILDPDSIRMITSNPKKAIGFASVIVTVGGILGAVGGALAGSTWLGANGKTEVAR